jgi:excinuclease UvrABC nuclease subunit
VSEVRVPPVELRPESPGGFTERDLERLPASHGVLAFEETNGSAVQLLSSADARSAARDRLLSNDEPSPRIDLSGVIHSVRFWEASCSLEADLIHARLGPAIMGDHWTETRSATTFFALHADPRERFPRFRAHESDELLAGELIGPFTTRRRAEGFAEELVDFYELCRKYERLVEAPNGTPCVYKEMGTCPAACDGSESMEAYRARFAEALAFAQSPASEAIGRARARMDEASSAMDFERAAREKAAVERIEAMRSAPDHLAGDLRRAVWLGVSKVGRGRRAYACVIRGGRVLTERVCDPEGSFDDAGHGFSEAIERDSGGHVHIDVIGALTRRFARPSSKEAARLSALLSSDPSSITRELRSMV